MLEILRERSKGVLTWTILLLIASAFALFGLSDFFSSGDNGRAAAKVNGETISWREVMMHAERLKQQQQAPEEINDQALREQVRMFLAQRAALLSVTKQLGYQVADEQIAKALLQIPAFQTDGKFSKERYLEVLKQLNETDKGFREEISKNMLLEQYIRGLSLSNFSLDEELRNLVLLLDQKRDFGYTSISASQYNNQVQVPKDEIKNYYENHKASFVDPEKVILEYVELSSHDLEKGIQVSKAEQETYYNDHKDFYSAPERVRVRHILVKESEKANELLSKIKSGADFATLAKENSIDPGSKMNGGDLGWFIRGQMVPEFENAAFSLQKPNEIAGPVKTQFGYHILLLVEHKPAQVRSFSEVQTLVEEQLKKEKAHALYTEKMEVLAKSAFEDANSLKTAKEQLHLQIKESKPFSRQGGEGIALTPEVVKMAYSDEILKQGKNSTPIKLTDENAAVVIRLKKHLSAVQKTLEQADKQIRETLVKKHALEKAQIAGEAFLKRIQLGENPEQIAKESKTQWIAKKEINRMNKELDRTILNQVFQVPHPDEKSGKPSSKGFNLPNGDYVVIAVSKVIPGDMNKIEEQILKAYRHSLSEISTQLEYSLYENQILSNAKVEFMKDSNSR